MIKNPSHSGQLSLQKIQKKFHSGENASGSISLYCWHSMIGKNMTLLQSKNFFYNNSVATMWCVHPLNFWPFTCNCIFRKLFGSWVLNFSRKVHHWAKFCRQTVAALKCADKKPEDTPFKNVLGEINLWRKEEDWYCKKNGRSKTINFLCQRSQVKCVSRSNPILNQDFIDYTSHRLR